MENKPHKLRGFLAAASAITVLGSANAALIGHWAFDEGTGATAADSSGNGNDGAIVGGTWGSDATRASYIIMDGVSGSVVDPNVTLPAMSSTNNFTWAFWANNQNAAGNSILIGNRYNGSGTDYAPRQFVKFTPTKFEWHQNGNGNDNQDYDDLITGEWHHHAVVKTGTSVQYYRDGVATGPVGTLNEDLASADAMRFFIGGNTGTASAGEVFTGYIDDVRIYDEALSAGAVGALAIPEPSSLLLGVLSLGMLIRRKR
jgi:hypothetical protein